MQQLTWRRRRKILYDTIKSCYDTDSHCCTCSAVHMVNIASNAKTCYRRIALCAAYDFWHTLASVVGKAVTPIGSDVIKRARWSFDFLRVCVLSLTASVHAQPKFVYKAYSTQQSHIFAIEWCTEDELRKHKRKSDVNYPTFAITSVLH